jgi:hypothetical protein
MRADFGLWSARRLWTAKPSCIHLRRKTPGRSIPLMAGLIDSAPVAMTRRSYDSSLVRPSASTICTILLSASIAVARWSRNRFPRARFRPWSYGRDSPVRDFSAQVEGQAANAEIGEAVCNHNGGLNRWVYFACSDGRANAGITSTNDDQIIVPHCASFPFFCLGKTNSAIIMLLSSTGRCKTILECFR